MSRYKFITTPFGNFAATTYRLNEWEERGVQEIHLEPLGQLDHVPLKEDSYYGEVLDHDTIDAEGARQQPELAGTWYVPKPIFTVNKKPYTGTVEARFGAYHHHHKDELVGTDYAHVGMYSTIGEGLTDSARAKLSEWILEHRDEIITPLFVAESKQAAAHLTSQSAHRALVEAEKALDEARNAVSKAADDYRQATQQVATLRAKEAQK